MDMRELRSLAERAEEPKSPASSLPAMVIGAVLVIAAGVGGVFAWPMVMDPGPVAKASAERKAPQAKPSAPKISKAQIQEKANYCKTRWAKIPRKKRKVSAVRAQEGSTQLFSNLGRIEKQMACLTQAPESYFCDADYRKAYIDQAQSHYHFMNSTSGSIDASKASRFKVRKRVQKRMNKMASYRNTRRLFQKGYLQRSDFSTVLFGEEPWIQEMLFEVDVPPRPC